MGDIGDRIRRESTKTTDAERDGAAWTLYEDYEIVGEPSARQVVGRGEAWSYRPLVVSPSLFGEFSRLGVPDDEDGQAETAREWAMDHGVLGLSAVPKPERKPGGGMILRKTNDPGDVLFERFTQGNHERDSVTSFVRQAWIAGAARTFYEAAMTGDLETVERLDEFDEFRPAYLLRDASPTEEARIWGTHAAASLTQSAVSAWCSPAFFVRKGGRLERGWGFKNLAGAMWLQFFWLLSADDDDQRCQNPECPNLRPALPHREDEIDEQGRMRRGPVRRYCSKRCENRHYYKSVTLPKRRKKARERHPSRIMPRRTR